MSSLRHSKRRRETPLSPYTYDVEWFPNKPPSERRRIQAEAMFEVELGLREEGMGDPELVYDEERELFRFRDGRFAFSRRHADWKLLRERGLYEGS